MTRNLGVVEAVQALLPDGSAAVLAAATQLGDTWFLLLLVALVYWFRDRRPGAFAMGTLIGGLALWVWLKALFVLPRPPVELRLIAANGYGFPSGHAITATVGWGVLALVVEAGTRRQRAAVAATAVVLVSFTRVALGVHFLVDVLAGMAVGACYLTVLARFGDGRPTRAFGAAIALSAVAVAVTGGGEDALSLLGASVGALVAHHVLDVPADPWSGRDAVAGLVAALVLGVVLLVGYVVDVTPVLHPVLGLVGGATVIALPSLVAGGGSTDVGTTRA